MYSRTISDGALAGLGKLRFLLADDSAPMRTIVATMLKGIGVVSIDDVPNGAAALASLAKAPVDIAIIDYRMEPINGLEFTRAVRSQPRTEDSMLPIIMLTGHADRARVLEARDAGVTELMVKPVTAQALISRLNRVIMNPRPFVKADSYFGPCRRHRDTWDFSGPERRGPDASQASKVPKKG